MPRWPWASRASPDGSARPAGTNVRWLPALGLGFALCALGAALPVEGSWTVVRIAVAAVVFLASLAMLRRVLTR